MRKIKEIGMFVGFVVLCLAILGGAVLLIKSLMSLSLWLILPIGIIILMALFIVLGIIACIYIDIK